MIEPPTCCSPTADDSRKVGGVAQDHLDRTPVNCPPRIK